MKQMLEIARREVDIMKDERRSGRSSSTSFCSVPGCQVSPTRKPYCIEHLNHITEVQRILAINSERDREATQATSWQDIDPHGSRAQEILDILKLGPVSVLRLAIMVDLTPEQTDFYLQALKKAGLIKVKLLGAARGKRTLAAMAA